MQRKLKARNQQFNDFLQFHITLKTNHNLRKQGSNSLKKSDAVGSKVSNVFQSSHNPTFCITSKLTLQNFCFWNDLYVDCRPLLKCNLLSNHSLHQKHIMTEAFQYMKTVCFLFFFFFFNNQREKPSSLLYRQDT